MPCTSTRFTPGRHPARHGGGIPRHLRADHRPGTAEVFRATCERTTGPADVALPVHALGAAYLGGTRLGPMAAAGLVAELRPGTLASLSAALSWDPAPWCPMMF